MNQNTNQAYFLTAAGLRVLISPAIIHLILIHQLCAPSAAQVTEYEVVGSQKPVTAEVGDDVVLPCKVEPPLDVTTRTVEWKCNKTVVHMYKSRSDNPDAQDKKFRTRTSLFRDEMTKGNISLKLVQVNETDAGIYTCYVRKLHDKVKSSTVTLIVAPVQEDKNDELHGNPTTKPKPENSNWYYLLILIIPIVVAVFWTTIRNNKRYKSPNDQGTVKTGQVDDTDPSDNAGNNMENTNITGQNCRGRKAQTGTVW
ncbi:myelin-oligodendrocyte glycoprotein-like isoform X2 [Channa argus]|uniref:myelin-oligodendrocyte glycoprotein-like isoform X2 n=1 Tax=Channa argus TaxID=215402 RepID=UPI0035214583